MKLPVAGRDEIYEFTPSKIIALGLNYRDHIKESSSVKVRGFTEEQPPEPVLFPKTPNTLIGDGETIIIPAFIYGYDFPELRTDYEAELALVIAERCKNVPEEEAFSRIFGYTCLNDVSQRQIQNSDRSGWFRGKSFDTFAPVGPRIVRQADFDSGTAGKTPQELRIRCRVNGEVRQDSNTSQMIFSIPEIVAFVSKNFTLEAGDIISTGTPAGVGPLHHGDVVEVEIESIGVLRNPVIEERMGSAL